MCTDHHGNPCVYSPSPLRVRVNKGVGVENVHYLCDGLWIMKNAQR